MSNPEQERLIEALVEQYRATLHGQLRRHPRALMPMRRRSRLSRNLGILTLALVALTWLLSGALFAALVTGLAGFFAAWLVAQWE